MQEIVKLIMENPDLPVIAMVDGEICWDDSSYWLGKFTQAYITDIGLIGERYYDERDDFKDAYYDKHDEELDTMFGYSACAALDETNEAAQEAAAKLDAYLEEMADKYMIKAIAVYINPPDMSIFKEAE